MIHLLIRLTLTWITVFSLVTGCLLGMEALNIDWPLPLRIFVLSLILVPLMMLIIAPLTGKLASRLVAPRGS